MRVKLAFIFFFVVMMVGSGNLHAQLYQQWSRKFGPVTPPIGTFNTLNAGNIVVDEAGNTYMDVQDNYISSILKFNTIGELVWRVDSLAYPSTPTGTGHYGLYYEQGGIYYLSQSGITKFNTDGSVEWQWYSDTLISNATYEPLVVFDPENNLIVIWEEGETVQNIAKINQNGDTVWTHSYNYGSTEEALVDEGFDLACDSNGNVYLEYTVYFGSDETSQAIIIKYDKNGTVIWTNGNLNEVEGIQLFLDPRSNGELYATTSEGVNAVDTIYKFDTAGNLMSAQSTSYYFKPFYADSFYRYYSSVSGVISSTNSFILKTDSDLNIIGSYGIPNCFISQVIWSDGNVYAISISTVDSTQAIITELNSNLQLIQTLLPVYSNSAGIFWPTGGIDTNGNVYLLNSDWGDSAELYKFCSRCLPNVTGYVFDDSNQNCSWDYNEPVIEGRVITVTPGPYYAVTNADGSFGYILPPGNYSMWANLPQYWNALCGDTVSYVIDSVNGENDILFGSYATPNITDVAIQMSAGEAVTGDQQNITVDYSNLGTVTDSGWVQVNIDSLFIFNQSTPSPDSISGNSFFWKYNNFQPGQCAEIDIMDSVPPYVFEYYVYQITASITPVVNDTNPGNNFDTIMNWVLSSFDPNLKSCTAKNTTANGYLTDSSVMVYTVSFQNTGSDTARKIVVVDTLSPNLDISTFTLLQTSFKNYQITILQPNILQITFNNIALPDSGVNLALSQAFIKYSVMPLSNLLPGTVISNSATIYFDFNPGVATNTTVNYFESMPTGINQATGFSQSISVYPNPMNSLAKIVLSAPTGQPTVVSVYDVSGRLITTQIFGDDKNMLLERNTMAPGLYMIELKQQNRRIGVAKIIAD